MTAPSPLRNEDLLLITFDALRWDVADAAHRADRTPFLCKLLPNGWEQRHTPGTFTYAAHAAIFAGFWPTPLAPVREQRPFALRFQGSRSIGRGTRRLDGENIVEGLQKLGYYTLCIGGVGFFNPANGLGGVFPRMFTESHWRPEFGVSAVHSAREQVRQAVVSLRAVPTEQPIFLFMNVSATHPPTRIYVQDAMQESTLTQTAALESVDRHLPPLWDALHNRGRGGHAFLMSDHGTLFGEDGRFGHRTAHPMVWNVPYAEAAWEALR